MIEPEKLETWQWYDIDTELPKPLFACLLDYIDAYKTGRTYFTQA
jgi:hypothetical protein